MSDNNDFEIIRELVLNNFDEDGSNLKLTGSFIMDNKKFIIEDESSTQINVGSDTTDTQQINFLSYKVKCVRLNGTSTPDFSPYTDNGCLLGLSNRRWTQIYSTVGVINTSDLNQKQEISGSDLGLNFINLLNPVKFKLKNRENILTKDIIGYKDGKPIFKENIQESPGVRYHYGLIAQEVESTLSGSDFGGLIKDKETGIYGLRYTEFIAPMIKSIQELTERVKELEQKLSSSV